MNIGIDFGGVIIKASEGKDFDATLGIQIEVDNAITTIAKLAKTHEIWIISKASQRVQAFTRKWFEEVSFYRKTGLHAANIIFCEKRSDKVEICEKLKIDLFIDDNQEIVQLINAAGIDALLFNQENDWQAILSHWDDYSDTGAKPSGKLRD